MQRDVRRKLPKRFGAAPIAAMIIALLKPCALWAADQRPDAPSGYEVAAENGAWVFRPAGETDSELIIRVIGPIASVKPPDEFLLNWVAERYGRSDFSSPAKRPDLSVTSRQTQIGGRAYIEALSAIRSVRGDYYVEQVFVPTDRADMRSSLTKANGLIAGAIARGKMPSPPSAAPGKQAPETDRAAGPAEPPLADGDRRSVAAENAGAIDSIAFDSKTHMGVGGFLTFDPTPMVLFKSGEAVDDISALNAPEGLAAHRSAHPKAWMHWRRTGKTIEVDRKGQWEKLFYTKTLGLAPADYRLEGGYQRISGSGNIAVGGSSSVVAWSNLSFDRSGAFTKGGGSGSSTETAGNGGVRVVTSGRRPDEHGTYEIDRFTLTLRFASGGVEQRAIVVDPAEPDVIWLDGKGWTRP